VQKTNEWGVGELDTDSAILVGDDPHFVTDEAIHGLKPAKSRVDLPAVFNGFCAVAKCHGVLDVFGETAMTRTPDAFATSIAFTTAA